MQFPETFESFLKQQQIPRPLPADVEAALRSDYERQKAIVAVHDARYMTSKPTAAGRFRYAVAIEDGAELWLTLWIERNARRECFILYPRGREASPHASYHLDGTYHQKGCGLKSGVQQRQPLEHFKGGEHLGSFGGHGPDTLVCDPAAFTSVLTVPSGILDGFSGFVLVDLVEPGVAPPAHHRSVPRLRIVKEETYRDCTPWVVIAIAAQEELRPA